MDFDLYLEIKSGGFWAEEGHDLILAFNKIILAALLRMLEGKSVSWQAYWEPIAVTWSIIQSGDDGSLDGGIEIDMVEVLKPWVCF